MDPDRDKVQGTKLSLEPAGPEGNLNLGPPPAKSPKSRQRGSGTAERSLRHVERVGSRERSLMIQSYQVVEQATRLLPLITLITTSMSFKIFLLIKFFIYIF